MHERELYIYDYDGKAPQDPDMYLWESVGIIFDEFFSGAGQQRLFWILTQTPQKVGNILDRQKAVQDILFHGADALWKYQTEAIWLEERLKSSDMVKTWKMIRGRWGQSREPLVYNHRKLEECVTHFQGICAKILSCLDDTKSDVFERIKQYLWRYTQDSEVTQHWQEERKMLEIAELPFLGMVDQEPWTQEVQSIHPIGVLGRDDIARATEMIRKSLRAGQKELTLSIGDVSITLRLMDIPFPELRPKQGKERQPKKYIDHDLFSDAHDHVRGLCKLFEMLGLYKSAADMYRGLKKQRLPVCFPTVVDAPILDVHDFYPLHCRLSPKKYVLNSLRLDSENPVALVTGLNSGGKSSLLDTMHCIATLSQAGFPIPARSATVWNFQETIHQEIASWDMRNHISNFRGQVKSARKFLDELAPDGWRLWLLDEAVTGTDHQTGARSVWEMLQIASRVIRKPTIIVTHCTPAALNVQKSPKKYPGIRLFCFRRNEKNKPTFVLEPWIGRSEGEYILEEEGLTLSAFRKSRKKWAKPA